MFVNPKSLRGVHVRKIYEVFAFQNWPIWVKGEPPDELTDIGTTPALRGLF